MTSAPSPLFSDRKTLLALLDERVQSTATAAATLKGPQGWVDVTWSDVRARVRRLSAALVKRGIKPGDRVAIFGATSLTWAIVDLAVSAARGVTVPIYASNTPDETKYILNDSQAVLLFVDDDKADARQPGRLTRAREVLAQCPTVREVVVFDALPALEEEGQGEPVETYQARIAEIGPDDLCHFIYTSGTTGPPKGVMLSHGNWGYEAWATRQNALMLPDDAVLLFLPLAHSFAQVVKAAWLGLGFRMIFAQSVDTLLADLAETRPTIMPSVPRVFEKVFNGVQSAALAKPGVSGVLARWAFAHFDAYAAASARGESYDGLGWSLARRLVFQKVKAQVEEKLGGRMRLFVSGGAPLPRKIACFFDLLGLKVLEGYGLTETSAATTVNPQERQKLGTVGIAMPGSEVMIAADGEVLLRGPGVMRGYHDQPEATAAAIDADGWFHSGDIGTLDGEGFLTITDRKKDLIITAGGKNIAPQNIESQLKTFPIVSSAMVYGDRRPYLTALVCVSEEAARSAAATNADYATLAQHPAVRARVQQAVDAVNAGLPPYSTLKKFTVMDHDFSQERGELTPTLKVKRKACTEKYRALLDEMYEEKL
jgi:long-chain acyl-CoA synthetase